MANRFASNRHALGICDRCGFSYKLNTLREEIVKGALRGTLTCRDCFDPDHPQLFVGEHVVDDPQALRRPRPDSGEYGDVRGIITPIKGVYSRGRVGNVTVTTT